MKKILFLFIFTLIQINVNNSFAEQIPDKVLQFAQKAKQSGDTRGVSNFAVIDKENARLWIFNKNGTPRAQTPILLGQAKGDYDAPDIGNRSLSRIKPHEKITPAGRFISEGGVNHSGQDIVWLDYESALSMHRVRNVAGENRHSRIKSDSIAARRISYGCVNIPASFFDEYISPLFADKQSLVYIMPEEASLGEIFDFVK